MPIMIEVLDLLFDISLAVVSAAATGSIFALLIGQIAVAHKHIVRHLGSSRLANVGWLRAGRARTHQHT
jgi:hypothetical protein